MLISDANNFTKNLIYNSNISLPFEKYRKDVNYLTLMCELDVNYLFPLFQNLQSSFQWSAFEN